MNEAEVVESLRSVAEVDIIDFVGMTFRDQASLFVHHCLISLVRTFSFIFSLFINVVLEYSATVHTMLMHFLDTVHRYIELFNFFAVLRERWQNMSSAYINSE